MPTVLAAGDIAIINYNSDDPDAFAFVFLRDVEAGTTINFTDNGWQAAGGFRAGEGTATYTAPTDIVAGTVVSAPLGTMGLSFLGDQIIAYQGTEASPTFLYAIDFADGNSAFAADATGVLTTALPPSLALGVTAIALPFDNAVYAGPTSGFVSPLDVLEAIGNPANWTGSDAAPSPLPAVTFIWDRASIDLDFNNSTTRGRDYRTSYNQGLTTVEIADEDIRIHDDRDDDISAVHIRVRNPQPDYLLDLNTSLLPPGIFATDYNPVTGLLTLIGEAPSDAYETAIRLVRFSSASADFGDLVRVDITIFDQSRASTEATAFIDITGLVGGALAAPVLDLDANNSNGGGADYTATFVDGGPAIPIADIDVNITDLDIGATIQSARVFLGINRHAADELLYDPAGSGITSTGYNPATGVLTLTGLATLDQYEAALRRVVYRSNSSTPPTGDRIFEVTVNDGTADSNVARTFMHVIDVVAVAPTLDLDANNSTTTGANYLTGFTEGGPAVAIADTDTDISDDGANILSATIRLTNLQAGDELSISGDLPTNISTAGYDAGTGILTLTGSATLASYEAALQQIVFSNGSLDPSTATRVIEIVVNDGASNSNPATAFVQVEAVAPIAPVLDLDPDDSGGSLRTTFRTTLTENGAPVPIADTDTSIIDADSTELVSATITLTNPQADDLLSVALPLPGSIVASDYDPDTGILLLTGEATLDQYEAALQLIQFSTSGDDPVAGDRLIEVVVNDGDNDSNVAAALISVVAVNDAPVFTIAATATYLENDPALPLSPLAGLTDADDTLLTSATVTITAGSFPGDGDVLTLNGEISGVVEGVTFEWHPELHALTLSGANSPAVYQELLQHIEFQSSSDNPTDYNASATRTLSWTISDGTAVTTTTSTLNIVAPNDPPEVTVAAGVTYTENAAPVVVSPAATVTDADSLTLTDGLVEIISGGLAGDILTVNGLQSGTFAGIDFSFVAGTGLVINGAAAAADYQAFLQAVGFHSTSENPTNSGLNPTRTLSWTLVDGQNFSTAQTTTIAVAALNDGPVAQNGTASGNEDTVISGVAVATDVDHAANLLTYALVGADGGAANGTVAMNDDGSFTYTPDLDFVGDDSFQFQATDPDSATSNVATITVSVEVEPPDPNVVAPLEDVLWQHDDGTVRTANRILGSLPDTSQIGATGDFDGDGDSDVVWHDLNTNVAIWEIEDGVLVQTHVLPTEPTTWQIEGSGDLDGDGDDDIVWRLDEGEVVTWEVDGGNFVDHHHLPVDDHDQPSITSTSWRLEGTGDFDGDGDDDLVWHHEDGLVVTWEMEDGAYVVNHNLPDASTNWQIDGTGDFDGDGDDDVLWRHDEGLVVIWEMEDGAYVVNHNLATVPTNWQIAGTADFDDNGVSDILWRHEDGTVVTWEVENGQLARTQDFGVVDNAWHIRGTGEFPLV